MLIKEEMQKRQTAFDQHVMGLIHAMANGMKIVERKHLKNMGMEFHVSPEAAQAVRTKCFAALNAERSFDDHQAELPLTMVAK